MRRKYQVGFCFLAALLLFGCGAGNTGSDFTKAALQEMSQAAAQTAPPETAGEPEIRIETEEEREIRTETEEEREIRTEAAAEGFEEITLLFGGDVYLSDHVLGAYEKAGGIRGVLDENYLSAIESADFFMVNQEFPFSTRGSQAPDKQFTFRLDPKRISLFEEMGIDGVTLANNHALDYGQDALLDSCEVLDQAGILHTGAGADLEAAGRPVSVERGGKRIAVVGATRVAPDGSWFAATGHPGMVSAYDPKPLLKEIASLRETYDYVIVYIHWGIERDERPQEYQKAMGRQMIEAGADLVIGAHPHVLQGIEYYQGKPIVYSLGNFVFGSSIPRTMLLEAALDPDSGGIRLRVLPGTSAAGYTQMLTDSAGLQSFYQYLESISCEITVGPDGVIAAK